MWIGHTSTRIFEFNAPGTRVDDRDTSDLALIARMFVDVPADDKPGALFADPGTHRMAAHVPAIGQGIQTSEWWRMRHQDQVIVTSSGPSGKFCNAQPRHKHCGQGAVRGEWQALSKGCNTAHGACGAALREPLCECDPVLRFLPREGPLPAKRALIRTRTVALNVTELSTWPTSTTI